MRTISSLENAVSQNNDGTTQKILVERIEKM